MNFVPAGTGRYPQPAGGYPLPKLGGVDNFKVL